MSLLSMMMAAKPAAAAGSIAITTHSPSDPTNATSTYSAWYFPFDAFGTSDATIHPPRATYDVSGGAVVGNSVLASVATSSGGWTFVGIAPTVNWTDNANPSFGASNGNTGALAAEFSTVASTNYIEFFLPVGLSAKTFHIFAGSVPQSNAPMIALHCHLMDGSGSDQSNEIDGGTTFSNQSASFQVVVNAGSNGQQLRCRLRGDGSLGASSGVLLTFVGLV